MSTTTTKAPKAKQTEAEFLQAREKEVRKTYKRVQPGTIRRETDGSHAGKLTVVISCANRGCKATRRVATSDLFQVRCCPECTVALRNKARRAKAAAAKGETAPAPEAEAPKGKKAKKKAAKPCAKKAVAVAARAEGAPEVFNAANDGPAFPAPPAAEPAVAETAQS